MWLQIAQKRKNLVDEMSIRIQQKSDDYKHQLSNLTNEFSNREEELKKQIEAFQVIYTVCTQYIQPCIEPHIWDSQRLLMLWYQCVKFEMSKAPKRLVVTLWKISANSQKD